MKFTLTPVDLDLGGRVVKYEAEIDGWTCCGIAKDERQALRHIRKRYAGIKRLERKVRTMRSTPNQAGV